MLLSKDVKMALKLHRVISSLCFVLPLDEEEKAGAFGCKRERF